MERILTILLFSICFNSMFAQNMGIKLPVGTTPNTTLDINGAIAYREGTALSVANGTNNNVALDSMSFYRITAPTANFTITGFTNGQNGRVLILINATSYTMTLSHLAGTSSAVNQIRTASATNLLLGANGVVTLMYSSSLTKWVVIGVTASNASAYNAWSLTGNSGTTAGTQFLGTTDNQNLVFKTNNATSLTLPVEGRGGLLRFNNNRFGAVYSTQIGFQSESYPTNVDTSFSIFGAIGSNDFFKIFGISTARTAATDGEFHIMSGDDGVEPIIFEQFDQAGSLVYERMRIHSDGHVGIGSNAPVYKLQIEEPSGYDGDIGIRLYNNDNITYLPSLILQASRGTKTTPTALTSGYPMGSIYYGGYDGSSFVDIQGAAVTARTTQDWTAAAHGAKLEFYTIPNGSIARTQRMLIDENGYVGIGVTGNPNQQLEITQAFRMPSTTSSATGVIYKDGNRFIHNYKPSANDGNNTFVGVNAGNFTMSSATSWLASGNTGVGTNTLPALTSGGYNTAIGFNALLINTTGSYNTAIGSGALDANIVGQGNTAIGNGALTDNTASSNTAVGNAALNKNTTGTNNTAIGESSLLSNLDGNGNTAIGQSSLITNGTGDYNTAIGLSALESNAGGNYNTAIGVSALTANSSGNSNTAIGYDALSATTSSNNVAVGYLAGTGNTSGGNNTFVGYNTGATNTIGTNITLLGYQANVTANNFTNSMALGNGATVNASNKVVIGNTSVTSIGGYANWTNFSDGRFKSNIKEDVPGLSFIKELRPVTYTLEISKINEFLEQKSSDREAIAARERTIQTGFIAQEVEKAAKKLGFEFCAVKKPVNERDNYALSYSDFVVPLVKAMQEQQEQIEKLTKENAELKAKTDEIETLKIEIAKIKKAMGL